MTRHKHNSLTVVYSVHVKINHIEFEDKFLINNYENVKDFLSEDC